MWPPSPSKPFDTAYGWLVAQQDFKFSDVLKRPSVILALNLALQFRYDAQFSDYENAYIIAISLYFVDLYGMFLVNGAFAEYCRDPDGVCLLPTKVHGTSLRAHVIRRNYQTSDDCRSHLSSSSLLLQFLEAAPLHAVGDIVADIT